MLESGTASQSQPQSLKLLMLEPHWRIGWQEMFIINALAYPDCTSSLVARKPIAKILPVQRLAEALASSRACRDPNGDFRFEDFGEESEMVSSTLQQQVLLIHCLTA